MVFVLRVFDIPIGRIGAEKRPSLRSGFLGALDLAGKIAAVQVIDQRPEGCIKAVYILRIDAVKSVVDGNEAYTEEREHARNIVFHGEIITAKAGQVLHDDAVGASRLYVLQHFLKARTLEIGAREAVVDPDGVFPKLRAGSDEIPQQLPLRRDLSRWFSAKGYQKSNGAATRHLYGSPSTI